MTILTPTAIDGVNILKAEKFSVCYIEELSPQLKDLIREELNLICHGTNQVAENHEYYSYQRTVKEFLDRYSTKKAHMRKGMLGELLSHLLIRKVFTNLNPASIFFNLEEKHVKKGFDLTYVDADESFIWYGEVKSGEVTQGNTPDEKNKNLLHDAKRTLINRFSNPEPSLWHNAITQVSLTLAQKKQKNARELLRGDLQSLEAGSLKQSVILVSVLFHNIQDKIALKALQKELAAIVAASHFTDILIFSIQKSTYSKIEQFLQEEASTKVKQ